MKHRGISGVILIGLMVLLAVSSGLNWVLYGYASRYHLELNLTRLDPLGLRVYRGGELPANDGDSDHNLPVG